jgi:hypothetical protein
LEHQEERGGAGSRVRCELGFGRGQGTVRLLEAGYDQHTRTVITVEVVPRIVVVVGVVRRLVVVGVVRGWDVLVKCVGTFVQPEGPTASQWSDAVGGTGLDLAG